MTHSISEDMLTRFSAFLAAQMGLRFPQGRRGDLVRGIEAAAREFGFCKPRECVSWLMSSTLTRRQVETLSAYLTVGESYFFREPRALEVLQEDVLPELLRTRRGANQRLRIWSAGCSTGEEPYTLAILLDRLLPDIREWNITILATDINPAALRKGGEGGYREWSFRNAPSWLKERYFTKRGNETREIVPQIRKMVSFEYLNLAVDSYPSLATNTNAMDLIFCRNVLMYFESELALRVVGKLRNCLVENGWLVVSPVELSQTLFRDFQTVAFAGATLYRKQGAEGREQGSDVARSGVTGTGDAGMPPPAPQFPQSSPAPLDAASELYRQGRYDEAASLLTDTFRQADMPTEALHLLIRSCANQGKLSEAISWCDMALASDKLNPALHYLRAVILQERGGWEEARDSLRRALYLEPNLALAHFSLGNIALREGKEGEARRAFENALAVLAACRPDAPLPESEGMSAGRLTEIIRSMTVKGATERS